LFTLARFPLPMVHTATIFKLYPLNSTPTLLFEQKNGCAMLSTQKPYYLLYLLNFSALALSF